MNLAPAAPVWLLVILGALLVAAAVEDAIRLRISNVTSIGVLATALVAMGLAGFPISLWQNAAVFALLLTGGTLLFAAGKIGGGDVKLLAALGLWFNFGGAVWLLSSVFIAGGILAIGFLLVRGFRGLRSSKGSRVGLPYGLAILAGALVVFASQLTREEPDPIKRLPLPVQTSR